jgi:hypothetical protein
MPAYKAGPNAQGLSDALRLMERNRDDRAVRRNAKHLDPVVRDAISGEPTAGYIYRLDCGHLINVWLQPLPEGTRYTYCEQAGCERERFVVEHITD